MEQYGYLHRMSRKEAGGIIAEDMVARIGLSERQKQALYTQYCLGEKVEDLAMAYKIGNSTAYRYVREMREKESKERSEDMASRSKIVAGDKANGRLTSTTDPHRFEGTCVIGGKSKKKAFTAVNAKNATDQWEKWCSELRDEQAFMDMVERKPVESHADSPDSPEGVCGYPGDPIEEIRPIEPAPTTEINARPWRDVAEERQQRIEELEAKVAEYESGEWVSADAFNAVAAERDELKAHADAPHGTCYAIVTTSESPVAYGFYSSEDAALADLEVVGRVAKTLGKEDAFTVLEGAWVR